jgi:hypothetical protein
MLEAGIFVALGLLATLCKAPWRWKLAMLSRPLLMDAIVFAFLIAIHWGTFTGVMAATIGAFFCSAVLSAGRWLVGYHRDGKYVRGAFDVSRRLQ